MTEDDARAWLLGRYDPQRIASIEQFLTLVTAENERQNLIAASSIATIWTRHVVDSAQLIDWASVRGRWIDVGTGGGFPGMIVAILRDAPITMVEPRKRRAAFLTEAVDELGLSNADVVADAVERCTGNAATISARAVGSVEKLLQVTAHCATPDTRWILPRGRIEREQLADLRRSYPSKVFHVEHSLTDPGSTVLIIEKRS